MKMRTTFRGLPLSLLLGGSDAAEAKFLGGFRQAQLGDIALQDHDNPVRYRNLRLCPLNTDGEGNAAVPRK
jgi:hypothetical protein